MRKTLGIAIVALAGLALGDALRAGDRVLPKEIVQARYVALGFDVGDAFVPEWAPDDARVLPDDRQTLAAIRAEIESWGRYKVVSRSGQAELFIAIRSGRPATAGLGGPVGQAGPQNPGRSLRLEGASSEDALFVHTSTTRGTPLWRGQLTGGLRGTPPPLFERFRSEVERAAK